MAILRRILKYTPAVVLGLLVVAWVVSLCIMCGECRQLGLYRFGGGIAYGTVSLRITDDPRVKPDSTWAPLPNPRECWHVAGNLEVMPEEPGYRGCSMNVPFALILTAILPVTFGAFAAFRFRLWHYLAYTALVAVELAYYLQWQG